MMESKVKMQVWKLKMIKVDEGHGFMMRKMNINEELTVKRLLQKGEDIYGDTRDDANHVLDYVQREMIKRGLRIKVHPRKLKTSLPVKGERYYHDIATELYG